MKTKIDFSHNAFTLRLPWRNLLESSKEYLYESKIFISFGKEKRSVFQVKSELKLTVLKFQTSNLTFKTVFCSISHILNVLILY